MVEAARKLNRNPFPSPMGISSTQHTNGLKPCVSCKFCSGYPWVWTNNGTFRWFSRGQQRPT